MHTKSPKIFGHLPINVFLLVMDQVTINTLDHIIGRVAESASDIHCRDAKRNHYRCVIVAQIVKSVRLQPQALL